MKDKFKNLPRWKIGSSDHGNGTQQIFYNDKSVFYGSIHESPLFPGTGLKYQTGVGNIFNAPIKAGTSSLEFINIFEKDGKKIIAKSCPARAVVLLNYCNLNNQTIDYIAEQPTSLKLNMFLPGKQIPIVNNEILLEQQPDYVVLLAWHYAKPIMEQLKERGLKSNFIIPLPDLTILEN